MLLHTIPVGSLQTNCYLLTAEDTREAILIDPGAEAEKIISFINKYELKITHIINTHGHYDHVGANGPIQKVTGAPIYLHPLDFPTLEVTRSWGLVDSPVPDEKLCEGQIFQIADIKLKVIHTPGHSPGGISLVGENFIFTGDTLFAGCIGRYDFPGSSRENILASVKMLMGYPYDTIIYPGHGPQSTIGRERRIRLEDY